MIKTFLSVSTKDNFKFYCDICLTKLEIDSAGNDSQKINSLEKKYTTMEKKLDEIKELLTKQVDQPKIHQLVEKRESNIWNNKERLETIKAPPLKSLLVMKKSDDDGKSIQNHETLENAIISNNIPIVKSFETKTGDLTVVCESKLTRDQLKDLASATNDDIVFITPEEKRLSITIVGLPKEYTKEEFMEMLPIQNSFIKQFAVSNDLKQPISIYAIRPLRIDPRVFQVFATVSPVLRQGLNHFSTIV